MIFCLTFLICVCLIRLKASLPWFYWSLEVQSEQWQGDCLGGNPTTLESLILLRSKEINHIFSVVIQVHLNAFAAESWSYIKSLSFLKIMATWCNHHPLLQVGILLTAKMVLADLGRKITSALRSLSNATIINEEVRWIWCNLKIKLVKHSGPS